MSMTDPIADMLTRIRNGIQSHHERVSFRPEEAESGDRHILKVEGFIPQLQPRSEGRAQGTTGST
jgi:small subunit ribosomal protein S8